MGYDIAEGSAARFAKNDTSLWCHRACADEWEAKERQGVMVGAVTASEPQLCGAPHTDDHSITCTRTEHGNGHHLANGRAWYLEPAQVASLKAQIAAREGSGPTGIPQEQVDALSQAAMAVGVAIRKAKDDPDEGLDEDIAYVAEAFGDEPAPKPQVAQEDTSSEPSTEMPAFADMPSAEWKAGPIQAIGFEVDPLITAISVLLNMPAEQIISVRPISYAVTTKIPGDSGSFTTTTRTVNFS